MNPPVPFSLAPMMQPAQDSTFLGAMQRARGMFPGKQGALPGVAPAAPQQGVNGLPTDQPMNGSGIFTGPASTPGFGPAAAQPGLLSRMWGSLAPGGGQPMPLPGVQPQTMPMMPPDLGASNGW